MAMITGSFKVLVQHGIGVDGPGWLHFHITIFQPVKAFFAIGPRRNIGDVTFLTPGPEKGAALFKASEVCFTGPAIRIDILEWNLSSPIPHIGRILQAFCVSHAIHPPPI
jgi:hypothetical protein